MDFQERDGAAARIAELEAELAVAREFADVLAGVLDAVPAIIMRVDARYHMRDINRVVSGMTYEEVRDRPFFAHVPEAERDKVRAIFDRVLATGTPEPFSTVGPGPDGSSSAYDSYVGRTVDRHGELGLVVVAIDVTERMRRERELAENEEKGRLAVEATGIGLWSFDLATAGVTWNENMYKICGVDTPHDPVAWIERLVHPDDREEVRRDSRASMKLDRFQTRPQRIVRPDGEIRSVVTSVRVLRDSDGTPTSVVGTTLDVTAARSTEERLRQTQRLEAVGQLAAGVAHNFNNILASIVPVLDLIVAHVPDRYRELVAGASHSSGRATELVRQLMTFAGQRSAGSKQTEPLAIIATRAISLCRHLLDPRVSLVVADHSGGALVRCDAGAIEQSIVNLVLNARDAIEDAGRGGGTIGVEITAADATVDAASYAAVRVRDDGIGMSSEVAARIFEPFFTTKDVGRGTGLGLAVSYATAREHGGSIACTSELGVGTTLELRLPTALAPSRSSLPPAPALEGDESAPSKVLLVDDDPDVRAAVSAMLVELGHTVVVANDAGDALERVAVERDLALVLLDRAMPGESGDRLLPALRSALPTTPIVFFTGEDVDETARGTVDAVLLKPASRLELIQLLARLVPSAESGRTDGRASGV